MNDVKRNVEGEARRRFILRRGVLQWGLFMTLFSSLGFWWLWGYPLLPTLALTLLLCPVGGYLWGALMWKWGARH